MMFVEKSHDRIFVSIFKQENKNFQNCLGLNITFNVMD